MVLRSALLVALVGFEPLDGDRVRIEPVEVSGDMAQRDRDALGARLRAAVERVGFTITEPDDPASAQTMRTQVVRTGDDYAVRIELLESSAGPRLVLVEDDCELCGMDELSALVDGLTTRLRNRLAKAAGPATLRVESDPPGASVAVDGKIVGTTPLSLPVEPGTRTVEITKKGHQSQRREAKFEPGVETAYVLTLAREGGIPTWVPWTSLAVGLATVAGGSALLVLDGREIERDCNVDIAGNCEFLHDTLGGGIAMTVIGGALVVTGVALLVVQARRGKKPRRRDRARRPTTRFAAGRNGLSVRFAP